MSRLFGAIGDFSVRFRWPLVVLWLIVTAVCVRTLPGLGDVARTQQSTFLPSSSPSIQAQQLAQPFQDSQNAVATIIAASRSGAMTTGQEQAVAAIEAKVRALPGVTRVQDFGLSPDREASQAQVVTSLPPYGTGTRATDLVAAIRATFAGSAGLQVHLTGSLAGQVDQAAASNQSQNSIQTWSFVFIVVMLLLALRALLAPVVTLLPAGIVLALAGPVIAAATHIGVQVSSITQFILIVLVLGAGTDYGLFIVFRMREEMRHGLSPHDAVRRAVDTVGESITFSAFIVIAALLSLIIAQFGFYQSLGPALAIGIALMLLAGLTLLPALLAIFGRAVFWPSKITRVDRPSETLYGRIAARISRRPLSVAIIGSLAFAAVALGQLGTATSGFADQSAPTGTDSAAGNALLTQHYGSAGANATAFLFTFGTPIWSHPNDLQTLQTALQQRGGFAQVDGPLNITGSLLSPAQLAALQEANNPQVTAALSRFVSADGRTVQYVAAEPGGAAMPIAQVPAARALAREAAQSVAAQGNGVFGIQPLAYDVDQLSSSDLWHVIPVVALLIAMLLAIVLRSLVAPLYLVASVVLSYLAALGLTAIVFVHLGGQAGINFVLPFLMFVFLMALGSDYNVLVMTRIREEWVASPSRDAVHRAIGATGTTVTTAGLILGGTFAVLALAGGGSQGSAQIQQIGFGVAFGVLMDTLVVRTILVPAFVALLGRWNWWPSQLSREARDMSRELAA